MFRRTALAVSLLCVTTAPACSRGGGASPVSPVPFVAVDASSGSPTDQTIAAMQARLRAVPADKDARVHLAAAFLQKVRETADPTYYSKADGLLASVGGTRSSDPGALLVEGTLMLARHQFRTALALGRRAVAALPQSEAAYGIEADADNELGRYDDALAATSEMVKLRPDLPSLSRVSYARELRGDLPGAIQAMSQAVTAGGGTLGENVAYVQTLVGNLLLTSGQVAQAERAFESALVSFPHFAAAQAGQAAVQVAQGHPGEAAAILAEVIKVVPLTQYAAAEGDDLMAAGQRDAAANAYALVDVVARLFRANGVNTDTEQALFDADHHPGPVAVAEARRALVDRPSIQGHDVLAWNLYKVGRLDEASVESAKALALGDRDPMFHYHAAIIAFARGDRQKASTELQIVLDTNARFNAVAAPRVAELATSLALTVPPA